MVIHIVCQHTVPPVLFTSAKKVSSRWCLNRDRRVACTRGGSQKAVQRYHLVWGVRRVSCMDESSTMSVGQRISLDSFSLLLEIGPLRCFLQRGTAEVPEVCTASEEALNDVFACVPLWKGKHTVGMAVVLQGAYKGLSFHLKSIFPHSVLWVWQLIKISSVLMCVTSKSTNCRLKSVSCWTSGNKEFHSNSSIYFEYVKGLGGITC